MIIYGVMILSMCMFVGLFVGELLGKALGVAGNVGGIGFAMLLLVVVVEYLLKNDKISQKAQDGIYFWRYMYIPLVVAMAMRQNVVGALSGGPVAIISGVIVVIILFLEVPLLTKLIPKDTDQEESNEKGVAQ
jgi:malonate transporter MadL subunit